VYERLIEDIEEKTGKDTVSLIVEIYSSWIDGAISNYNTDFIINHENTFVNVILKERYVPD
jgi:hypothetical protein